MRRSEAAPDEQDEEQADDAAVSGQLVTPSGTEAGFASRQRQRPPLPM